jgi:plastocyanin
MCWGNVITASCAGIFLISTSIASGQAVIEGRVKLPAPESMNPPPPRYAGQVGEIAPPDPPTAVVYLEGQFPKSVHNPSDLTNEVKQIGMQFRPALLPVQVGTKVAFPNGDDFYHNVFSYSKTKRFDLGRYRKYERPPPVELFDKPGVVKLYCDIHQHMRGVILVLDTPCFTRTDTNGVYRLQNLPSGSYVLKAWVDEKHIYEAPVELKPGKRLEVNFDTK